MGIIYISLQVQHGCQGATWRPSGNMEAKEQHGGPRNNMEAKEQHGSQGATWMPRNNMEAKEKHGGQAINEINMKATRMQQGHNEETRRREIPPHALGDYSARSQ